MGAQQDIVPAHLCPDLSSPRSKLKTNYGAYLPSINSMDARVFV